MSSRRQLLAATFSIALIFISATRHDSRASASHPGSLNSPQVEERERGVKLYEQGDTAGAVLALQTFVKKQKNDIRAWHYLGLSLARQGKTNDARKAHEKAAKIAFDLIADRLKDSEFEVLSTLIAQIKPQLVEAAESADEYLKLSSKPSQSKITEWRERSEFLRDFTTLGADGNLNKRIFKPTDVTTKATILAKPAPEYSEEARRKQTTGTVVLLLILSADGKVRGLFPISSLPHGLTEMAIKAARGIKFTPATKDGQPVSQFVRVEYNFNIY